MLLDALSRHLEGLAAERGGVLGVLPGLVADDSPGWIPAADLLREPYEGLLALVDETAARWNAPRHVAAALLWKTYGYWHTMPMVLGWALHRRVPLMRLEDTLVRPSAAGVTVAASRLTVAVLPDDPAAGGTVVVPDLAAAIRAAILDGQRPFVRALSAVARVGERTLWGSTAEAVAHPLLTLGPYAEAARLLEEIGPPVAGLLAPDGDGYRRRTCCLWITLPDAEPCSSCCVPAARIP
ncbi:(2Fe-2S)-binding protein [Microbispora cellulosiformans]|uniref:(2Fe-2S)-binding protein n=1 Tax=Microbispora cellulosiformans TaxID=2614688 RepID=A0A5J5K731_9ACTN|nr:(2Fe-2S)-binding protein [Microbispora cellulosiformans]KAA9379061.1 (2Fe-2S)-binding protein [Microbispora cellulosiformans]